MPLLTALPERERSILLMRFYGNMTQTQINLLAALDPARHARPRTACRPRRHRTHPRARTGRPDRADLQRDPPAVHDLRHRTPPRPTLPRRLVALAPTPPTPRPNQPLPAPRNRPNRDITIYRWSIRTLEWVLKRRPNLVGAKSPGQQVPLRSSQSRQLRGGVQPSSGNSLAHEIPDASCLGTGRSSTSLPRMPPEQVLQRESVGVGGGGDLQGRSGHRHSRGDPGRCRRDVLAVSRAPTAQETSRRSPRSSR
jgi:hypothetical protein